LGFSDAAHLSRLFRARYGSAPSDYRAGMRD
jgi:AraC-like DNA-binding protein